MRATIARDELGGVIERDAATFWYGVPCIARRCVVEVLSPDGGPVPEHVWYHGLVGDVRPAVEVILPAGVPAGLAGSGAAGRVLWIDDERGYGWMNLTRRRGWFGVIARFHAARVLDYVE